jgi:class 3 adenylate cyclase/CHASE2 domain-containing sensor protein
LQIHGQIIGNAPPFVETLDCRRVRRAAAVAALCLGTGFAYLPGVKLKPFKLIPGLIASGVILLVCLLCVLRLDWFERLERMTYDVRARTAARSSPPTAANLGFVFINDDSIRYVRTNRTIGLGFGLYWPRQVYGRLAEELAEQGARAVAFDVIFGELRHDHALVSMADGQFVESDEFFAHTMRLASNVVLAVDKGVTLPGLFATNALALGDVSKDPDRDGILRRAHAFVYYTNWHRVFRQVEEEFEADLSKARVERGQIVFPRGTNESDAIKVPLDAEGNIDLADFADKLPPGLARRVKPFVVERVWNMGIVLAARQLGLDLTRAEIDLPHGRITLRGAGGVQRVIPVDEEGCFYIDWCMPPNHPSLTEEPIESLLAQHCARVLNQTDGLTNRWRGKLVVVGSMAVGNDLTDMGATPLVKDTYLASEHWNVANLILMDRFIRRASLGTELLLIVALGILSAFLTLRFSVLRATGLVLLLVAGYAFCVFAVFVQDRYWLPLVLPVWALGFNYVCLVVWRVVFEQAERRRVKSILSTMVSPKIADVLVDAKRLSLGGTMREITVFFADVRGFTEFTDTSQAQVAEYVRKHNLTGEEAEALRDAQARETLNTINLYLGLVGDTVLKHDGALDKFIGDCVMAFWGAPNPEPRHALACVRAAIDAQRAVFELNKERAKTNKLLEKENLARRSAGLEPKPLLPILLLGTGINTGVATVGLMGSEVKQVVRQANYTVFGREVNLASRLESASGRGRIFIGETTFQHLQRDDPALAATCRSVGPTKVKGISAAVNVYEVPWRPPEAPPFDEEFFPGAVSEGTSLTGFTQREGA